MNDYILMLLIAAVPLSIVGFSFYIARPEPKEQSE